MLCAALAIRATQGRLAVTGQPDGRMRRRTQKSRGQYEPRQGVRNYSAVSSAGTTLSKMYANAMVLFLALTMFFSA